MRRLLAVAVLVALTRVAPARADGFQLERYEPSAAGSWFLAVQAPWYSSTRGFAAALTLDYGHDVLLGGVYAPEFHERTAIVEHQLVGHLDVAGALLDRVLITGSIPVVLLERGASAMGSSPYGVSAIGGAAAGDPRLGVMVRLWGHPERDRVAVSAGGAFWLPIGADKNHAGDQAPHGLVQVAVGGLLHRHWRYAADAGVLIRKEQTLGFGPASTAASELQLGLGAGWTDLEQRWLFGPELSLATQIVGPQAFSRYGTSLELLLAGQYWLERLVKIGFGVGTGLVAELGTPDVRLVLRVAWAPTRRPPVVDQDGDGVADDVDACPGRAGPTTADPRTSGCPDGDRDGVPDAVDVCPTERPGAHPDAHAAGCPVHDADQDGVPDAADLCPTAAAGAHPDAAKKGCPAPDADQDGVPDAEDQCPQEAAGGKRDPARPGCAAPDQDHDGVPDAEDQCPTEAPGEHADAARAGCPAPDADGDGIADDLDACPKDAGLPSDEADKNGCPKLSIVEGAVLRLHSVHFETNKWDILPESFPILDEVVRVLQERGDVEHVIIEGHADDRGTHAWNMTLSRRRAQAVVDYLVRKGIPRARLSAVGYGDTRPLSNEKTDEARAANRRVEVRIPRK